MPSSGDAKPSGLAYEEKHEEGGSGMALPSQGEDIFNIQQERAGSLQRLQEIPEIDYLQDVANLQQVN
jgi:hypothetical protein